MDNIVFIVDGGLGKNLMATVPLRGLRKKYPDKKIIVLSGHPDMFFANPNVDRVYRFDNALNFYDDYIISSKSLVFKPEPYLNYDYIYKNKHLTEVWCEMLGVEFDNPKPDLFLTSKELSISKKFTDSKDKPIMLVQISGGVVPVVGEPYNKIQVRELPDEIAQGVVDEMSKYTIIQVRMPTQPELKGTEPSFHRQPKYIPFSAREILSLIPYAEKMLFIDSFMQHAAAALEKKAVVVWGNTSPITLGYNSNINLTREVCKTPYCCRPNTYLMDKWECPYGEDCINHQKADILKALNA